MATFLGYEEIKLTRPIGEKKTVKVKCLPVRMFAEYAALFAIESELVGLATDLTREEVDMLLPEDSGRIFEKVHELNRVPFTGWLRRKAAATRMQAQILGASLRAGREIDLHSNAARFSGELRKTRGYFQRNALQLGKCRREF